LASVHKYKYLKKLIGSSAEVHLIPIALFLDATKICLHIHDCTPILCQLSSRATAEIYMMEGRSFWPIAQRVKQGRQLKKDSVNDSNVPDGLRNITEGVPSLPPVESQDTAYKL
jgi:hypothetical protein